MKRRVFNALAASAAVAGCLLAGVAFAEGTIKIGTIAPKTGPLAAGANVTHWPNVQLWAHQVNEAGGIDVGGEKMMVEIVEYDDKTNPGEHIKLAQRLAEVDKVDFIIAPYGTGFNLAAAPIYARYDYPMIAVSAISDNLEALTARYPNLFFTLGTTTSFVEGVRDVLVGQREAGVIHVLADEIEDYVSTFGDLRDTRFRILLPLAQLLRLESLKRGDNKSMSVRDELEQTFASHGFEGFDHHRKCADGGTGSTTLMVMYPRDGRILGYVEYETLTTAPPIRTGFETQFLHRAKCGGVACREPQRLRYAYGI